MAPLVLHSILTASSSKIFHEFLESGVAIAFDTERY